jgi:probable HAF family extracellular repeat protein
MKQTTTAFLFLAALLCAAAVDATPPVYHMTDLGTLGGDYSYARGISSSGQVVGEASLSTGFSHAFVYSGGVMTDLGTLGGSTSSAYDINASGQIVGWSYINTTTFQHGFLYTAGHMNDIGSAVTVATSINDSGQIAGYTSGVVNKAVRYSNGTATMLGTLGGLNSRALSINASGQIVGDSGLHNISGTPYDAPTHAFRYSGGPLSDLGVLQNGPDSYATAINDAGQIAGYGPLSGGPDHAFLYSGGVMTDLGVLGLYYSQAIAISSAGQVVGQVGTGRADPHAFLYTDVTMYDLNNLLDGTGPNWNLNEADAINDSGWIAATARVGGESLHAVLLTPVPEPSGFLLAAVGATSLWMRNRLGRKIRGRKAVSECATGAA